MFRPIVVALLVGSVCAFWDTDSDNYRDSFVDNYRDSDSGRFYDDSDDSNRFRMGSFGRNRWRQRSDSDDFYDDDDSKRFLMGGLGRRQWQQQRSLGFQPQRRQSFSRLNTVNRRSRNSGSRRQRQNSWSSLQNRPQRRFQTQSRFSTRSRTSRRPAQSPFQSQGNFFGGNRLAQAAMMYNAFDGFDFF